MHEIKQVNLFDFNIGKDPLFEKLESLQIGDKFVINLHNKEAIISLNRKQMYEIETEDLHECSGDLYQFYLKVRDM